MAESASARSVSPGSTSSSLLERVKANDQQAWQRLVRLYGPLVYGWCRRAGLQATDAADVFQEVFRSVAAGIAKYRREGESGSFRRWLRAVVRSKIADHFRKRGFRAEALGGTDAHEQLAQLPELEMEDSRELRTSEQTLLVRRTLELIRPAFAERSWQAFWQLAVEGRTTAEVAGDLEMTEQAVRQASYRVRRRLRDELRDLLE